MIPRRVNEAINEQMKNELDPLAYAQA